MLTFNFSLMNPFSDRWNILLSKSKQFGKKAVELNLYRTNSILRFLFEITTRCDHAGTKLELGFLTYELEINFYDTRHWDYVDNCWMTEETNGQSN